MNAKTPNRQEDTKSDEEAMNLPFLGVMAARRSILSVFTILICTCWAAGQSTRQSDISFDQRSPLSVLNVQVARYGVDRSKPEIYETAKEKFSVVLPAEY